MYSVRLGFDEAVTRIQRLLDNGHHAEALLTSVFTAEKMLLRAVKVAAVCSGLTSTQAKVLIGRRGFDHLKALWSVFSPTGSSLDQVFGPRWHSLTVAKKMRNGLVHGARVYPMAECESRAREVLEGLETFRTNLEAEIGHDGWSRLPTRRKSALGWDPPRSMSKGSKA